MAPRCTGAAGLVDERQRKSYHDRLLEWRRWGRMSEIRAHVYVAGRVQGVMYRETTRREATHRGVRGWVRNLADGRVEAVFEGEERDVRALVQWCYRGPTHARVDSVVVDWEPLRGEADRFEVLEGWEW